MYTPHSFCGVDYCIGLALNLSQGALDSDPERDGYDNQMANHLP